MSQKDELQEYLEKLQRMDEQIKDDSDPDELLNAVNRILKELSTEIESPELLKPQLKYINKSNNPDPTFAHEGDSGFDIRAFIDKDVIIPEWSVRIVPTGLYVEVIKGLEVQVRTRSGMAANSEMFVLNSPGTVDSKYRDQIKVILANFGDMPRVIRNGDRIAQGVVCPVYGEGNLRLIKVDKLSETIRGTDGLGSTGIH
jgi:dUTP pyrophosphatase